MDIMPTEPTAMAVVETSSSALAAQVKATVEARYTVAIARPRDLDMVRERLIKDARRPGFADVAIYQKPIGKDETKWPTGPSIRFAEAAIRAMGNCIVEAVTVFDDKERRIVRVSATDLESNTTLPIDVLVNKTVERSYLKDGEKALSTRLNSYGKPVHTVIASDDDVLNKVNAMVSKAYRTAALRLVPGDIVEEVMDVCWETRRNQDAQDPETAKKKLFDAFGRQGVTVEQLKAFLGHEAKLLTAKEHETLRGVFNALKEGETTWREVMDAREKGPNGEPPTPPPETPEQKKARELAAKRKEASPAGLEGMAS
jgi:hypothetical protein